LHTVCKFGLHVFGLSPCTGAAADFQQATTIATAMVKRFGMSEKVKLLLLLLLLLLRKNMFKVT